MSERLKIDFSAEHRLAICRPVGLVGTELVGQILHFLLAVEECNQEPFNRLLDLTLATDIQLSGIVLYTYARARREATAHLLTFRTAIVASDPDTEDVAQIYAKLMEGSKIQVRIFSDTSSAANWLGVPDKVVRSELAIRNNPFTARATDDSFPDGLPPR